MLKGQADCLGKAAFPTCRLSARENSPTGKLQVELRGDENGNRYISVPGFHLGQFARGGQVLEEHWLPADAGVLIEQGPEESPSLVAVFNHDFEPRITEDIPKVMSDPQMRSVLINPELALVAR